MGLEFFLQRGEKRVEGRWERIGRFLGGGGRGKGFLEGRYGYLGVEGLFGRSNAFFVFSLVGRLI